jgi:arylsulfatase A-like enzyme
MYYASQSAHGPHTPPESMLGVPVRGESGMNRHTDMIYEIDVALGLLLAALEDYGLANNTLVVFTSDNGGIPTEKHLGHDSVGGLRGKKGEIHEGGHRVPLIFKWGDGTVENSVIPPGQVSNQLVAIQDIFATVASAVGADVPENQGRDSRNLLPVLKGEQGDNEKIRQYLVMEADQDVTGHVPLHYALREHDWKLILDDAEQPVALYNITSDIAETTNRVEESAQQQRIMAMLDRLNVLIK